MGNKTYRIFDPLEVKKSQLWYDEDDIQPIIVLARNWIVQQAEKSKFLAFP